MQSPPPISAALSARYVLVLGVLALGAGTVVQMGVPMCAGDPGEANKAAAAPMTPVATDALAGIWWRYEAGHEGAPVRFYYFHGDGKGLYRYGKVGLTNTHSFDYTVEDDVVRIAFRKTGEVHRVGYSLTRHDGRDWLVLHDDPEEPGATRYFRERPGPIDPHTSVEQNFATADGPPPSGHMWIDHQRFATGGNGFSFYQFRPSGIDGRGVGWHHRGDFDDWSTEAFTYRIVGDRIGIDFSLADQHAQTSFVIDEGDPRQLWLAEDPRDFWHQHRFDDAGPSFGTASADAPIESQSLQLVAALAEASPHRIAAVR